MTDHERRIRHLEQRNLQLEAESIMQTQALGVLLALLEDGASSPEQRLVPRPLLRKTYNQMLRKGVDDFLAMMADHDPNFAAKLRTLMQRQLDNDPPA